VFIPQGVTGFASVGPPRGFLATVACTPSVQTTFVVNHHFLALLR
jgi:hypothetical protein